MNHRWRLLSVVVVIAGLTAGCGAVGSAAPTSTSAQSAATVSDGPAVAAPIAPAVPDQASNIPVAKMGQSINFPDGLSVSIGPPERKVASKSAAPTEFRGAQVLLVTVTVANKGSAPITVNPGLSGPDVTYGGQTAPKVFDVNYMMSPETTVLPGKSFTYRTLHGVGAAPGELQLQWKRDVMADPAIFTGQG